MDSVGIYVGTSPDTIRNTGNAIMDILQCPHTDEKTKQIALKTMASVGGSPSGNSISNCHIQMPPPEPQQVKQAEEDYSFMTEEEEELGNED